jgi:cation diffusion facilitator family transporter
MYELQARSHAASRTRAPSRPRALHRRTHRRALLVRILLDAAVASERKFVVYTAIAANLGIAITKFIAAALSGSSALFSEAIHSVVDTGNECLLLVGLQRSKKPPDARHPFGRGKELYFWSLIVAIVLFGAGAGASFYEGISHLIRPKPLRDPFWGYVVIAVAAVFEGISFTIASREFKRGTRKRGTQRRGFWSGIRRSKDPSVFTVLLEDLAALVGVAVAFLGLFLGHALENPYLDGVASIVIGVVLSAVAFMLAFETRGLLVGESTSPEIVASICEAASRDRAVHSVQSPLTMHLGPDDVLLNLEVEFRAGVSADEQLNAVARIEDEIRRRHPEVRRIFIEARRADGRSAKSTCSAAPRDERASTAPITPSDPRRASA